MTGRDILVALAHHWRVRVSDLQGPRKHKDIARKRHIAAGLIRMFTEMSYPEIGRLFGGRDHSTIMNSYKRFREMFKAGDRVAVQACHVVRAVERSTRPEPFFVSQLVKLGVRE